MHACCGVPERGTPRQWSRCLVMLKFIRLAARAEYAEEPHREFCGIYLSGYLADLTAATTGYPLSYASGLRMAERIDPPLQPPRCDCPVTRCARDPTIRDTKRC